jgi:hypothetical protein
MTRHGVAKHTVGKAPNSETRRRSSRFVSRERIASSPCRLDHVMVRHAERDYDPVGNHAIVTRLSDQVQEQDRIGIID